MSTKSPGGPQRCRLILQHCLAIQLAKPGHTPEDFWMYDSGYMIFQNFLAANSQCWWNTPLTAATRALKYAGHVAPGMLLVTAEPCALEVLRGAYARSVLKPPATYVISSVGDIDDCIVTPAQQGQFTPLPEALCDVIMELTSQVQSATLENIRVHLSVRFPHMQSPSIEMIYDCLAQLMQERKIYQTSKGYFIVTPERRRSRSSSAATHRSYDDTYDGLEPAESRIMLMTNSEAVHNLYGEITTERDGDLTHQCIQTNLADVICGGNPNDKILYPRSLKRRSASFPTPRSLERRHSLRLFGSSKRLQRCASTKSLSKNCQQRIENGTVIITDSSSSEYHSTDSSSPKKASLLSRIFRRSGRTKQRQIETFSAQFPPIEWFNSKAIHLHSVGTQTNDHDVPTTHSLSNSIFYDGSDACSQRSSTLPRRHRRHMSSESTFLISSRDCSPIRRRSPGRSTYCSTSLPRSAHSITTLPPKTTQRHTKLLTDSQLTAKSTEIYHSNRKTPIIEKSQISDRDRLYRSSIINSGPSSFESGKMSMGPQSSTEPSSIDSGKVSMGARTGHSSLESNGGTRSPVRSFLKGSPKFAARQPLNNNFYAKSQQNNYRDRMSKESRDFFMGKPPLSTDFPPTNSNNSITLQVTTSNESHNVPSTKIYVQNSPVRSVITLENGQLTDNSNVFIIQNETTHNEKGELIKKSLSKQTVDGSTPSLNGKSNGDKRKMTDKLFETTSETGDSLSLFSETSPESSLISTIDSIESSKFTKNTNNDATMNNSRKLSLQIPQQSNNIIYKNVLKDMSPVTPTSPSNIKNITEQYESLAGSVGNLRAFEKNQMKLSSNFDLKHLIYEPPTITSKLNSNPTINTDSLAHMLHKNIIAVGSEPNLTVNNCDIGQQKLTNIKSLNKESLDRRFSLTKDFATNRLTETEIIPDDEMYNFPSLTDLSFNFTSLAAKKILQGVSINSIDTLVELNMGSQQKGGQYTGEKQQNVQSVNGTQTALRTDYGLV